MPDSLNDLPNDCCMECAAKRMAEETRQGKFPMRMFIVCPICGNKRCPKATHHDHICSGSNEPGQEGSYY